MNRTTVLLLTIMCFLDGIAQCGMTSTFAVSNTCNSGGGLYSYNGTITGGIAPYTIHVQDGTKSYNGNSASTGWLLVANLGPGNTGSATLTITDNTGCVFSTTQPVSQQYTQAPILNLFFDCASGWRLDWTGWYTMSGSPPCPTPNGSSTYWLDGATGSISSAWTLMAPSTWRYNLPLATGSHQVYIFNTTQCPGRTDCFPGSFVNVAANPVNIGDCGANVSVRAALQGALPSGTLMHDSLRVKNLIPLAEPYSALGYSYTAYSGSTSMSPSLLAVTGNNAIVDWVILELRNGSTPAQVMFSKPALLQRDGDVIDLDGDAYVNFPTAGGSCYIALRHRDHLGVMTASTRSLGVSPTAVDLRLSTTGCYGTEARTAVGTVQCMWTGDLNGDGAVKYTGPNNDRDPILVAVGATAPNNVLSNQYSRLDVNMDGSVKYTGANNDRDPILLNVGSTTPNNTRVQQLP